MRAVTFNRTGINAGIGQTKFWHLGSYLFSRRENLVFLVTGPCMVEDLNMEQRIRVADEVWIVAASLHRDHPNRSDFTIGEIMARAESENVTGRQPLRPGVRVHAYLHCVANRPPNPGRYRMLVETKFGRRRLFRPGDPCHPLRTAGKDMPRRHEIPSRFHDLIDWYVAEYAGGASDDPEDPVMLLRGLGAEIWADEDADEYVRRLRSSWQ